MPGLVREGGGKKSSAADSLVVNQDLVLFWESEAFIRMEWRRATILLVKTSSSFFVNTSWSDTTARADVRWIGQTVVIQELSYLSSRVVDRLRYLGASVMLFSCSRSAWNGCRM